MHDMLAVWAILVLLCYCFAVDSVLLGNFNGQGFSYILTSTVSSNVDKIYKILF